MSTAEPSAGDADDQAAPEADDRPGLPAEDEGFRIVFRGRRAALSVSRRRS